ncbi:MAG: outer membrane lipoprotein chaperone LolA, partial [Gammaproteobacteria bacterium]|nr:outer membrane lipoprotein chaperone LolA [Gammaproteobacteria bacterium]
KLFFTALLLCSSTLFAATPAQQLSALLASANTISADFKQTVFDDEGTSLATSTGQFILSRPDKFYWVVNTPSVQIIVNDGKKIWNYQPDLEQVVVMPAGKAMGAVPLAILSGSMNDLQQAFTVTQSNSSTFKLTAIHPISFQYIWLYFSNGKISGMKLQDRLNQSTQLNFINVKLNETVDNKKFVFTPPKGVDIVNGM